MAPFQRCLSSFRPKDPYHLILLVLPWLLLALNVNWPFANGENWDPWFYWGHSHAYPRLFLSSPCYDGERLPVILPGYLFHHLFAPVPAQVLLHTTIFYIAIFSLYFIIKINQDRHTALLVSTLMACHSFFIGAIGWDYIDGFAMAYYLFALALFTQAPRSSHPRPWITGAAATCAACFYTNPVWVIPVSFLGIYYLVPGCTQETARVGFAITRFAKSFLIGFAAATIVLGLVNYQAVGTFWFYTRSLSIVASLNSISDWNGRDFSWLARATWLVYPTICFLGVALFCFRISLNAALAYLWPDRFQPLDLGGPRSVLLLINFGYCFVTLVFLTFIKNHRVLEFEFYADLLLAPMFLALGSGILTAPKLIDLRFFFKVLALAAATWLIPLFTHVRYTDLLSSFPLIAQHSVYLTKYYLILPLSVGFIAIALIALLPRSCPVWRLSVMGFCLAGFGLVPEYTGCIWAKSYNGPARYARVAHALAVIRMNCEMRTPPFFWYSSQERYTGDYNALCMAMRGHGSYDVSFPSLAPNTRIPPDSLILILTENKDIPSAAEQSLRRIGLRGEEVSKVRIANRDAAYWITFLIARRGDAAATVGCSRPIFKEQPRARSLEDDSGLGLWSARLMVPFISLRKTSAVLPRSFAGSGQDGKQLCFKECS